MLEPALLLALGQSQFVAAICYKRLDSVDASRGGDSRSRVTSHNESATAAPSLLDLAAFFDHKLEHGKV